MLKENFEKALKQVLFHSGVILRGLVRTLYGTLIAMMIGFSIYGFVKIQSEDGYAAVFDFVASCAVLIIALVNAYALGNKKRGKRK